VPFVNVKVIAGVFDAEEKRQMVEAIVAVEAGTS
jgi:phenylpyruvate tautomerase PptA (4-oxalocrotonate tautomerase family)